jgi:hypothetical protein
MHNGSSWAVTSIDNSGSAAAAGVMPGDTLTHINGNSVATLSSRQISALLRGAAGSHCSLSLWRNTVGGGSAHLEARVQRKIPSHPDSISPPRELPESARSSRSLVYADPEDSDPDAEAKLHAQLSQISLRLDEMEQKIRAPGTHSEKFIMPVSVSNVSQAPHSVISSSSNSQGNGVFSLKSPSRPRLAHRSPSTSTPSSHLTVPQSPSRSVKPSVFQPQQPPAMRNASRPVSATTTSGSPSKFGASEAVSHAADISTSSKSAASLVPDKTRTIKSNLFPSHSNASNEAPALKTAAAAPIRTFQGSVPMSPECHSHSQEQIQQQAQTVEHRVPSTPPRDQQLPLQLQQLLQKLLRQVEDAERQRLVRLNAPLRESLFFISSLFINRNSTRCVQMMTGAGKILCVLIRARRPCSRAVTGSSGVIF